MIYKETHSKNSATNQQDKYGFVELTYSEQKTIDKELTFDAFEIKIEELIEFFDENNLNEFQKNLENFLKNNNPTYQELKVYYDKLQNILFKKINWKKDRYDNRYFSCKENINLINEEFEYFNDINLINKQKEFNNLYKKWQILKNKLERSYYNRIEVDSINQLQKYYIKLQKIFFPPNEFDELLHYKYTELTDSTPNNFEEKFGIATFPNIIWHEEEELENDDLSIEPENIKNSNFFSSLFEILNDDRKNLKNIQKYYNNQKISYKIEIAENINECLKNTVTKRFNELYHNNDKNEFYSFKLGIEDNKIEFYILKNNVSQKFSQQSVGFKWFFNFFFNFLYTQNLKKGDIVLIDEFGANLSIPAQRDLRSFLKNYTKQNGITFIISTHSPFLVDLDYLDELRIINQKEKSISEIKNSFSIFDENEVDALREIKQAFGTQNLINLEHFIFVEEITDYNYLIKFKLLYEIEKNSKLNLAFLPINGLGKFEDDENILTEKQKQLIEQLPKIAKANKDKCAILLVDNDKAIKEYINENKTKNLTVFTFNELLKNNYIKTIESIFSLKDRQNLNDKKIMKSQNFKNNYEPDNESKERFYKLLEYLNNYIQKDK